MYFFIVDAIFIVNATRCLLSALNVFPPTSFLNWKLPPLVPLLAFIVFQASLLWSCRTQALILHVFVADVPKCQGKAEGTFDVDCMLYNIRFVYETMAHQLTS